MKTDSPATIRADKWDMIADHVRAGRVNVWFEVGRIRVNIVQHISGVEFICRDEADYLDKPIQLGKNDTLILEWLDDQPAATKGETFNDLVGLYLAMKNNPGDLEKEVAYFKALARARLTDAESFLAQNVHLAQQLDAERQRAAAYRAALEDLADGSGSEEPANYQEAARYWKGRHDLFVGIAREALKAQEGES